MAKAFKCDVCKVLYENYNAKNDKKNPNGLILINKDINSKHWQHDDIDLCPNCMRKIMDILEGKV